MQERQTTTRGSGFRTRRNVPALLVAVLAALPVAAGAADDGRRLIEAVRAEDAGTVRALLDLGADVRGAQPDGATALHWASYGDAGDLATLLLAAGADVDAANDYGITPLALRLRERLRGNGAAAARSRRGPERSPGDGRDAADDLRANRRSRRCRGVAGARRGPRCGGVVAQADGADVGGRRGAHPRGARPRGARSRRRGAFRGRLHPAPDRGARGPAGAGSAPAGRGRRGERRDPGRPDAAPRCDVTGARGAGHQSLGARRGPERRGPRLHRSPLGGRLLAHGADRQPAGHRDGDG